MCLKPDASTLLSLPSLLCRPLRPKFIHPRSTVKPHTGDSQLANKENEHRAESTPSKLVEDESSVVAVPSPVQEVKEENELV